MATGAHLHTDLCVLAQCVGHNINQGREGLRIREVVFRVNVKVSCQEIIVSHSNGDTTVCVGLCIYSFLSPFINVTLSGPVDLMGTKPGPNEEKHNFCGPG